MKREEFEDLYEEYAPALYGFLAYRTGDPILAEDLLADTFERVWTAKRGYDKHRGSAKTWIYSIALNRLRDVARRSTVELKALERVGMDLNSRNGDGAGSLEQSELRQVLMASLQKLAEPERESLALRFGADLALQEIADVLEVPRSTVEGRLQRGLRKLWSDLAEEAGAQPAAQAAGS